MKKGLPTDHRRETLHLDVLWASRDFKIAKERIVPLQLGGHGHRI